MRKRRPIGDRFWPKVNVAGETECWLWNAALKGRGYGEIGAGGDKGKPLSAHRVSWEIHFGAIPDGLHVLHHCDTPSCVNPRHLFLGTNKDNVDDMVMKKRHTLGERNPMSKLNNSDVRAIRHLVKTGWTHQELANIYGVACSNITMIANRRTWKHIT